MPHLTLAQDKGRYFHFYSMMILLILAKEASGDASGSMDALKQLLSYTENEGFIRLYLDGGQRMANILRRASNDGIAPSYIQKLLNEFSYEPDMVPIITSEGTLKPLSRRELQVLNLVSNGLSNREIAEELFITVGTTKRHLVNIFRKLGVSNRMQAVAKARELELIN
jgi:LuxR family maltose regulon positive regulatory protein